mgnify:CR=1 FL=1
MRGGGIHKNFELSFNLSYPKNRRNMKCKIKRWPNECTLFLYDVEWLRNAILHQYQFRLYLKISSHFIANIIKSEYAGRISVIYIRYKQLSP